MTAKDETLITIGTHYKMANQFAKEQLEAVRDKIKSLEPENYNGIEVRIDCIDFINEQIKKLNDNSKD